MSCEWLDFIKKITAKLEYLNNKDGCDSPCFRGQADSTWHLMPSLFVKKTLKSLTDEEMNRIEGGLYFDFLTDASTLLDKHCNSWEVLFTMRHHGIPTRVLDWSQNFGAALFFALNGDGKTPTIWILDPYKLNGITYLDNSIPNPIVDLKFDYESAYLQRKSNPYVFPLAIVPPRTNGRLFAQKGLFTLQGSDSRPLDLIKELKGCISKYEIPPAAIADAHKFLSLAGINEYSIYPDLDGLGAYLTKFYGLL